MVKLSLCLVSKKESYGFGLGLLGDQIIEPRLPIEWPENLAYKDFGTFTLNCRKTPSC